jgi:hemoglobin
VTGDDLTDDDATTVYEAVGGAPFFEGLTIRFYERVEHDAVLRPLYPASPDAFEASRRWLALFLAQYWGGPTSYSDQRGHPRLRMRHAGFLVGRRERDAWYEAMAASVAETEVDAGLQQQLLDYFAMAADHMINVAG